MTSYRDRICVPVLCGHAANNGRFASPLSSRYALSQLVHPLSRSRDYLNEGTPMKDFEHPPLKRHESLQPFSRDHFIGLRVANRLINTATDKPAATMEAITYFKECWDTEIAAHFNEEEELLTPLMTTAEIDQMQREHTAIRQFAAQAKLWTATSQPPSGWCWDAGNALHDHIRWEERTLFGAIQNRATPDELLAVAKVTAEIEKSRPGLRKR